MKKWKLYHKTVILTLSSRVANLPHNQVNVFAIPQKTVADYSIYLTGNQCWDIKIIWQWQRKFPKYWVTSENAKS